MTPYPKPCFVLTLVLVWATAGLGCNMLSGYSGMISFGHAAFFRLGGYATTIAFVKFYPRAEAARAHRDLGARRTVGSSILLP